MIEKDKGHTEEGFTVFVPVDAGIEGRSLFVEFLGLSSDKESAKQASIELSEDFGASSWSMQEINPDGSTGEKKFYFSGATWKAPWQPRGPKPNWGTEASPNEPIN